MINRYISQRVSVHKPAKMTNSNPGRDSESQEHNSTNPHHIKDKNVKGQGNDPTNPHHIKDKKKLKKGNRKQKLTSTEKNVRKKPKAETKTHHTIHTTRPKEEREIERGEINKGRPRNRPQVREPQNTNHRPTHSHSQLVSVLWGTNCARLQLCSLRLNTRGVLLAWRTTYPRVQSAFLMAW